MQIIQKNDQLSVIVILLFILLCLTACTNGPVKTPGSGVVGVTVFTVIYLADPAEAIDVIFIPDNRYGDVAIEQNRQTFLNDISELINQGFYQNNTIANNLGLFNFWYMNTPGDVQAATGDAICPTVTWPDLTDAAFAESIVLLHPNELRDCAWGRLVTSESASHSTVVHETSHAALGLADEYCCDGGYWDNPPQLYDQENTCTGDTNNVGWRDCKSFTAKNGNVWWRSEGTIHDMMSWGSTVVLEYGTADWFIVRGVLTGLGPATVYDPDVFAPDSWDMP